jgi:hypothetical protein
VSHAPDWRPGALVGLALLAVYGGVAVAVDFPRAAFGFQSDEATYYLLGHSLAHDADLEYRREDLTRVWREFPTGPSGVFLKRGRDVTGMALSAAPPFFQLQSAPDQERSRLYYGKAFIYPLFAAPFVRLFGTNGFLLLNALLLALTTLTAYLFLNARASAAVAALGSAGFVLASVTPGYFVWITPEIFNFALVLLAYFCWFYREVAPHDARRGMQWLQRPGADLAAAILLALATFSKPSNVLLIAPPLLWLAWQRRWSRALLCGALFGAVVAGLFAVNTASAGDWNYQGGERSTCYGGFPFQTDEAGLEVCLDRATNRVLTEVIFDEFFLTRLAHNIWWFFVGRHSGLVPYFFPAVFALAAFLLVRRARLTWQWFVLAAALAQIVLLIVWIPYNYFGGGGVLGNRYFMSTYGLFLFLLPPLRSPFAALVPWMVGALFSAPIVLNPFYSSFRPAQHPKHGPLRWLPVELSLVNDLPINTDLSRVRQLFGENLRFQVYFLDDNAYPREENSFWVRGESTAELLMKTPEPVRRLAVSLASGASNRVTVRVAGESRTVELSPAQAQQVVLLLDRGFPYQGTRVWLVSVTSEAGFVPMFTSGGTDSRFLGVRVKPELLP